MTTYIDARLRRRVRARAKGVCEYCLIHERDTFLGCQIDHIVAEKHGGVTASENLAFACTFCNRAKGTDLASIDATTGELVRLFNPRVDRWNEHFEIRADAIEPLGSIGSVTVRLLGFNTPERRLERQTLASIGRYPPPEAQRTIGGKKR
jgi:hypothetical protein